MKKILALLCASASLLAVSGAALAEDDAASQGSETQQAAARKAKAMGTVKVEKDAGKVSKVTIQFANGPDKGKIAEVLPENVKYFPAALDGKKMRVAYEERDGKLYVISKGLDTMPEGMF